MKIRFKTWYWGKFVLSGSVLDGSVVTLETEGFELYDEKKHGAQNDTSILSGEGFSEFWKKHPALRWNKAMQLFHAEKRKQAK